MNTEPPIYGFFAELSRIINTGQSRSVLLYGNIHDLFSTLAPSEAKAGPAEGKVVASKGSAGRYAPLATFLAERYQEVKGQLLLIHELNGPIRVVKPENETRLKAAWVAWSMKTDMDQLALLPVADKSRQRERERYESEFEANMRGAIGEPTRALEFLRQLTICSRSTTPKNKRYLDDNLIVIVEAADMLLPTGQGDVSSLNMADRHRVGIVQDWFSEPGFLSGDDSVILLAESASQVHPRAARLPSVMTLEVPAPDQRAREHYIEWYLQASQAQNGAEARRALAIGETPRPKLSLSPAELAAQSAGLSIHALRQLLLGCSHGEKSLEAVDVTNKVEAFIQAQLGEDVVEFKKPTHSLRDVVGFSRLKAFIQDELIPRFRSSGPDALPGAAVAGPIGGGKTFIFEAAAAALGLPVIVLKNIRSQWYGQTDVIFERLRRVLMALGKVIIVVDEADTQFGGVGPDAHETERRLTGKIQAMMSDPALRGKVIWLLMTARIHLLSPDIRRPGRVGDLIIPVLDPEGEDRLEFLRWILSGSVAQEALEEIAKRLDPLTPGYSAAAFASLRSSLKAKATSGPLAFEAIEAIVRDLLPPAIELARKYQMLQALVNCTRRSLLPDPNVSDETRRGWADEIRRLELMGIR